MTAKWLTAATLAVLSTQLSHPAMALSESMSACLLKQFESADVDTTVGELYSSCAEGIVSEAVPVDVLPGETRESVVGIRVAADFDVRERPFAISPLRPNYIMFTYNGDPNEEPYMVDETDFFDKDELKFQVSFQMPLATGLFGGNSDLLFGYTSTAWWQALNRDIKSPFRETNYEPELILRTFPEKDLFGLDVVSWEVGLNHESNGQSDPQSRGWDRAIATAAVEVNDDLVVSVRTWAILDTQTDNADIEDYRGYGEIGFGWAPNRSTFTGVYRPARERGAVELTWSYPITRYTRIFAQYFNGYGESLIDYDHKIERFGIGIAMNDFLSRD